MGKTWDAMNKDRDPLNLSGKSKQEPEESLRSNTGLIIAGFVNTSLLLIANLVSSEMSRHYMVTKVSTLDSSDVVNSYSMQSLVDDAIPNDLATKFDVVDACK